MDKRWFSLASFVRAALILLTGAGFGIAVAESERPRPDEPSRLRIKDLKFNSTSSQDPDAHRLRNYLNERDPASEPSPPPSAQTENPNGGLPGTKPEEK